MSSRTDIEKMIHANNKAIIILNEFLARLADIHGESPEVMAIVSDQINRTQLRRRQLLTINAHLRAANVVIQPLSADLVTELKDLEGKLDDAIKTNAIINSSLDFVISLVNAAQKISDITGGATA